MVNTVGFNHVIFNQPARDNTTVVVPQTNQSVSSGGVSLAGGGGGSLTINLGAGAGANAAPAMPSFSSPFVGPMMGPAMAASVPAATGGLGAGGPAIAIALLLMGLLLGGSKKAKPKNKAEEEGDVNNKNDTNFDPLEQIEGNADLETRKTDLVNKLKEQLKAVQDEMAKPETQADAAKMEQLKKQEAALKEALAKAEAATTVGELEAAEAAAAAAMVAAEGTQTSTLDPALQPLETKLGSTATSVDTILMSIEGLKKKPFAKEEQAIIAEQENWFNEMKQGLTATKEQLAKIDPSDTQKIQALEQQIQKVDTAIQERYNKLQFLPLNMYKAGEKGFEAIAYAISVLEAKKTNGDITPEEEKNLEGFKGYWKKTVDRNGEIQSELCRLAQVGDVDHKQQMDLIQGVLASDDFKAVVTVAANIMKEHKAEAQKADGHDDAHGSKDALVNEGRELIGKLETAKKDADEARKKELGDAKSSIDEAIKAHEGHPTDETKQTLTDAIAKGKDLLKDKEKGGDYAWVPWAIAGTALAAAGGGYKYYRNIKAAPLNVAKKGEMGFWGNLWNLGRKLELTSADRIVVKDGKYVVEGHPKVKVDKKQALEHLKAQLAAKPGGRSHSGTYFEDGKFYNGTEGDLGVDEATFKRTNDYAAAKASMGGTPAPGHYWDAKSKRWVDEAGTDLGDDAAYKATRDFTKAKATASTGTPDPGIYWNEKAKMWVKEDGTFVKKDSNYKKDFDFDAAKTAAGGGTLDPGIYWDEAKSKWVTETGADAPTNGFDPPARPPGHIEFKNGRFEKDGNPIDEKELDTELKEFLQSTASP